MKSGRFKILNRHLRLSIDVALALRAEKLKSRFASGVIKHRFDGFGMGVMRGK